MTNIAVSAHNLHKSFPVPDAASVEVLHGISCSIEQGRMTSMVGSGRVDQENQQHYYAWQD